MFVIAIAALFLSSFAFVCVRFGELCVNGCTACVMQKGGNGRKKQERKPWSAEKVVVVVVVVVVVLLNRSTRDVVVRNSFENTGAVVTVFSYGQQ